MVCVPYGAKPLKKLHSHFGTVCIPRFPRPRFLPLFFFFFLRVNSNLTWVHCSRTVQHCLYTVQHCSCTVYVLKNIKNSSHDIIYTFKNYFATVFSIFSFQFSATISSIQTDPLSFQGIIPPVPIQSLPPSMHDEKGSNSCKMIINIYIYIYIYF